MEVSFSWRENRYLVRGGQMGVETRVASTLLEDTSLESDSLVNISLSSDLRRKLFGNINIYEFIKGQV